MNLKRFLSVAVLSAVACLSMGDRAHATFTVTPDNTTLPSFANLTFTSSTLANAVIPTPASGVQFQFLTIAVANTANLTVNATIPYSIKFTLKDDSTSATSVFNITGNLLFNVTNGTGTLTSPSPAAVPPSFIVSGNMYTISGLVLAGTTLSNGNPPPPAVFVMTINGGAVPEPASFVAMGLGVTILGGLGYARRRRTVA